MTSVCVRVCWDMLKHNIECSEIAIPLMDNHVIHFAHFIIYFTAFYILFTHIATSAYPYKDHMRTSLRVLVLCCQWLVSAAILRPRRSHVIYPPLRQTQLIFGDLYIRRRRDFFWNCGEHAEQYFLQKILLPQPFKKEDRQQRFLSKDNVSKTYMQECILCGLFQGYEEEAREPLSKAEVPDYSVDWLRLLAEVLRAEDILDATFFNNYMSDVDEPDQHQGG